MYIDILHNRKANYEKDKFKAEKCRGILKSLNINTIAVDDFLENKNKHINKILNEILKFNDSNKRTDMVTVRIYANDSFNTFDGEDLNKLTEIMRKFKIVPYVSYYYNSDSYRKLCFVSDKPLSEYEVEIIYTCMVNKGYFKSETIDELFRWDGNTLDIMSESTSE